MVETNIITRVMDTKTGSIVISVILGLGIASLFRKVCRTRDCIVIKGPELKEVQNKVFKFEDKCYTYEPTATKCT